jgi:hypothetical protein
VIREGIFLYYFKRLPIDLAFLVGKISIRKKKKYEEVANGFERNFEETLNDWKKKVKLDNIE